MRPPPYQPLSFGKLSRFTVSQGKLCFASRMMDTEFYNLSIAKNYVAPSMLFMETTPPRGFSGLRNLAGPNDNVRPRVRVGLRTRSSAAQSQESSEMNPWGCWWCFGGGARCVCVGQ